LYSLAVAEAIRTSGNVPSQDEINDRHKAYLDYRAYLRTSHVESSRSLDEALAALSSGAIAISISFVHFLVPDPVRFGLMASAWLLFASTLTVNLLSFLFAVENLGEL